MQGIQPSPTIRVIRKADIMQMMGLRRTAAQDLIRELEDGGMMPRKGNGRGSCWLLEDFEVAMRARDVREAKQ